MSEIRRLTIHFCGHVQGVGFRFTVMDIARDAGGISGYVRNMSDGRVELVMEGEPAPLEQMVDRITRTMGGYIHSAQQATGPATGEFTGFRIQH